jgi:hypothetical protein
MVKSGIVGAKIGLDAEVGWVDFECVIESWKENDLNMG